MSEDRPEAQGFFARKVPARWFFLAVAFLLVVLAAVVLTLLLVDKTRDSERRAAAEAATSTLGVSSPYDLTELPADTDLDVVDNAAFISILVPNAEGKLTSYGMSSELPTTEALVKAVKKADKVGDEEAATLAAAGSTGDPGAAGDTTGSPTITFVLPTRETLTFVVNLEQGLIVRGDQTWRPDGDLKALIEAAIAGP